MHLAGSKLFQEPIVDTKQAEEARNSTDQAYETEEEQPRKVELRDTANESNFTSYNPVMEDKHDSDYEPAIFKEDIKAKVEETKAKS